MRWTVCCGSGQGDRTSPAPERGRGNGLIPWRALGPPRRNVVLVCRPGPTAPRPPFRGTARATLAAPRAVGLGRRGVGRYPLRRLAPAVHRQRGGLVSGVCLAVRGLAMASRHPRATRPVARSPGRSRGGAPRKAAAVPSGGVPWPMQAPRPPFGLRAVRARRRSWPQPSMENGPRPDGASRPRRPASLPRHPVRQRRGLPERPPAPGPYDGAAAARPPRPWGVPRYGRHPLRLSG